MIRGNTVGTTMPRTNYEQTDSTKADYLKGKDALDRKIEKAVTDSKAYADGKTKIFSTVLVAGNWTGTSAPYTQTIHIEGILETDNPFYGVMYDADQDTRLAQKEAFAMVDDLDTADGSVTFTCFEEKPGVDIPIRMEVHR